MTRIAHRGAGLLLACLALGWAANALAAEVYWEQAEPLAPAQRGTLDLAFIGTEPAAPLALPSIGGLRVLGSASQSRSFSIINGTRSASVTVSFPVRAERPGTVHIPEFRVETTAGAQTVPAFEVEVGAAAAHAATGGTTHRADDAVRAELQPSTTTPYAGEVIDLDLRISLVGNRRGEVIGAPSWRPEGGVVAEPWSEGRPVKTANGRGVGFHTRAMVPAAGRVELAPAEQEVQIESGGARARSAFDPFARMGNFGARNLLNSFFGGPEMTAATVRSNSTALDVKALPEPAPEGFTGSVGQFSLASKITPENPKVGEPITWTLTLAGNGNWPSGVAIPARAVPADLRTLAPKQRATFGDADRFSGSMTEDLVLVPSRAGDLAFPPVRFVFFNPDTERYETAAASPPVIHIAAAPAGASGIAPQPAAAPAAGSEQSAAQAPIDRAVAAPLHGSASGRVPLPQTAVALLAATPLGVAALYWLVLTAWRAIAQHPRVAARRVRRELRRAVQGAVSATTDDARIAALLRWQRASVRWLHLELAAPHAAQLAAVSDPRWAEAWAGSEQALYRRGHTLPAGWRETALALSAPPGRERRRVRLRYPFRRWNPKAATAMLLLACFVAPARGTDAPAPPVRSGTHAGAATAAPGAELETLRARVAEAPLDWIARYNLGIAEANAGAPGRALGETLAAFLQAPGSPEVRAHLAALIARQPSADASLAQLAAGARLASAASPWMWQVLLIAGAVSIGAGLIWATRRRFAIVAIGIGAMCAASAAAALHQYGPLVDPRAALTARAVPLRGIPTDAQPSGGAPTLPAGEVVTADGQFLGWTRVRVGNGAKGWLRHTDLVLLYAAPSA